MKSVNDWLRTRTYHHTEFRDLGKLVRVKERQGLSISVCFPTLNEEKTIGKSVVLMKAELMDRYPLIDEIAVVDSGSTDRTCEIAREFGADTYRASEYLPEEGEHRGKGENLWKALYLLKGDIIVYIDADIQNIHHRFAYGLIGPLLLKKGVKFVKAFYKRPVVTAGETRETGGGRVTEILIRPLFSQFFPDLSVIIQPLSGEYAGYREIFERIPFPIGYGVETGMLIDIYQKWGLDIIAQTDLDQRVHRNQSITALGKMSFGILQTFWDRLHKYKKLGPVQPESYTLRQIDNNETGKRSLNEIPIREMERQPMIELESYSKQRATVQ
jgi:glucosyl-3-phosphoglycerate synthase